MGMPLMSSSRYKHRVEAVAACALAFAAVTWPTPTEAQQTGGSGGNSYMGEWAGGGGTTDPVTGVGGNGGNGALHVSGGGGGGGGAAGITGGTGGAAGRISYSEPGGTGGTAAVNGVGGDGGDGADSDNAGGGASGGGGGAHGWVSGSFSTTDPSRGGAGGNGGRNAAAWGGNGGGGGGGYGAFITGLGGTNTQAITGGAGGTGGSGTSLASGAGGGGGAGGIGVFFTGAGSLTNWGAIQGGAGGAGGYASYGGNAPNGAGGAGVVGSDLLIINSGTIAGGMNGDGVTRADAITFTGGNNTISFVNATAGLTGNIGVTGALYFMQNSDVELASSITGTGAIQKSGSGTLVLTGAGSHGGGTTISAGALQIGNGGTTGAIAGDITNNAALIFDRSDAVTYSSIISGTGEIRQVGTGILTLTGTNTYAGGTTISAGTLQLGDGGTTGAIAGNVTNHGILAFNRSDTVTFSDTISGNGAVSQVGSGTTILSGSNTYLGGTTISSGMINARNAAALGFGGVSVASGAALEVQFGVAVVNNALTLNGTGVAGGGAFRNVSGSTTMAGGITLGSASRINADSGTLILNGGITGADRSLIFGGAGFIAVNDAITTGTGALIKDGSGSLTLLGTNTYTGTTTIEAGWLGVHNGRAIADTGAVIINAPGMLNILASETIGSLSGDGRVLLQVGQRLTTGGDDRSTTFSGAIDQVAGIASSFAKIGTGTLTLSGNSTYIGATTIDGGTLSVNGSIASSSMTTVNSGGTLGGNGIVGNTTINGGTLAPGNSIDLLTVQGNLVFTAASTYMVEVSPANADRVNVTGTATLGGATVNASFAPGSYVNRQYTIVNATGGVIGTFGTQVNTDLPSNFKSSLRYDANNAYLDLALDFTPVPPTPGPPPPVYGSLNANQAAVGNALTGFFNRTGGIPLVFGALNAQGLSQASGEVGTGSQQATFDAMNLFMGVMTDPFAAGRGDGVSGAAAYADQALSYAGKRKPIDAFAAITKALPVAPIFEERWTVWTAGFGGSRSTDANTPTGSNNTTSSLYGTAVGADYWFSPNTVAGFSLAGGGTNFAVNGGGSGRSDLFQAGTFLRHTVGSAYVSAAAAYGWQDVTTDRTVAAAGFERLHAQYNAYAYSGRIEMGNRFVTSWLPGFGLTPYGAVQATAFDLPTYAETGAGSATTFALAYAGRSATSTRSELGLRSDRSFALNDAILTLRGRAAWAHDFNTDRSIAATFQALPGASFVVNGAAQARHAALATASAEMKWMNGWAVAATFEGEFSDVTRSYSGTGVVRYAW